MRLRRLILSTLLPGVLRLVFYGCTAFLCLATLSLFWAGAAPTSTVDTTGPLQSPAAMCALQQSAGRLGAVAGWFNSENGTVKLYGCVVTLLMVWWAFCAFALHWALVDERVSGYTYDYCMAVDVNYRVLVDEEVEVGIGLGHGPGSGNGPYWGEESWSDESIDDESDPGAEKGWMGRLSQLATGHGHLD